MNDDALVRVTRSVPPGAWAVGVSGGADSVALLALLRTRTDLSLHVAHLDHQTRGQASAGDARFVRDLAGRWGLPCTVETRDRIDSTLDDPPANAQARYRAARLALFRRVVDSNSLQGVILAHHADDQAETVLHRLLRSAGAMGLAAMQPRTTVGGLVVLRPLLGIPAVALRQFLRGISQPWREDASNVSPDYLRNRLRVILGHSPGLFDAMIELSEACAALRAWVRTTAPRLPEQFAADRLAELPDLLARESAARWLVARGVPPNAVEPAVVERLLAMCRDAATPSATHFPRKVLVRRRRGEMFAESADR